MATPDFDNGTPPGKKPLKRNKELTKQKLIDAVGEIISREGYTGLGVNKIANQAMVSKKLIYKYFGTVDKLIELYVLKKDFWMLSNSELVERAGTEKPDLAAEISRILEEQFDFFISEKEMQQLIIWELSGSTLMKRISVQREKLGEKFMMLTDAYFEGSEINFRTMGALLSAGIYYMILHAPVTSYCGVDLNLARDRAAVKKTIKQILNYAFEQGKAANKKKDGG